MTRSAADSLATFAVYHPRQQGGGQALKIEPVPGKLRSAGVWKAPGLFAQLATQAGPLVKGGGAPFAWTEAPRFMFGERDCAALRFAYREIEAGRPLPQELRPPNDNDGWTCSLVHRGAGGVVLLHWSFTGDAGKSFLRLQSNGTKQSITLSVFEGFQLACWLEVAHAWLLSQAKPWRAKDADAPESELGGGAVFL